MIPPFATFPKIHSNWYRRPSLRIQAASSQYIETKRGVNHKSPYFLPPKSQRKKIQITYLLYLSPNLRTEWIAFNTSFFNVPGYSSKRGQGLEERRRKNALRMSLIHNIYLSHIHRENRRLVFTISKYHVVFIQKLNPLSLAIIVFGIDLDRVHLLALITLHPLGLGNLREPEPQTKISNISLSTKSWVYIPWLWLFGLTVIFERIVLATQLAGAEVGV